MQLNEQQTGSPEPEKTKVDWEQLGRQVVAVTEALPEAQREPLRWLYNHAQTERLTAAQTARAVGIDGGTLNRVYGGKYGAKLAGIAAKIVHYRALFEQRVVAGPVRFVETSTTKQIAQACGYAHVTQSVALIYGDSQIGKTWALKEFASASDAGKAGQVIYVRMPASGNTQIMLAEIMAACGLSAKRTFESMRGAILEHLNERYVLIVDELHQVFSTYAASAAIKAIEILREIHDRTECGLVLCGTNVLSQEIRTGKMAPMLAQLHRRGLAEVHLPSVPSEEDADTIAAAFGLPPARDKFADLQALILREHGLGKFTKYLRAATRNAETLKEQLSWPHFERAHDIVQKLKDGATKGGR